MVSLTLNGVAVDVPAGMSLLEACDRSGAYIPRLCSYPGLAPACEVSPESECGLCLVRVSREGTPIGDPLGTGRAVHACTTPASSGLDVRTDDAELRAARLERLASILAGHPRVCLACPDRDGCSREECTYENPTEARCCDEFGRCELARLIVYVDPASTIPVRGAVEVRDGVVEGLIRREPGLCVGCGRCFVVCETSPEARRALVLAARPGAREGARSVALPREETLRQSGCTFCGRCVLVCPTGALAAPGEKGARWLAGRRERSDLRAAVLPPVTWEEVTEPALSRVRKEAGVLQLLDAGGRILRISGVANLRQGLAQALGEPSGAAARYFLVEADPIYTQRESELLALYAQEHGKLPPGNDLGDELFTDPDEEDLF